MALAPLSEHSVTHLNLDVDDVAASERFYHDELGLPVTRNAGSLRLRTSTFLLVLAQGRPQVGGSFHFGFRLASRADVDAWFERFRERGVIIIEPPSERANVYVGSINDPDGYRIEIYCETDSGR